VPSGRKKGEAALIVLTELPSIPRKGGMMKTKALILFALLMGIFTSALWVVAFVILLSGRVIEEPSRLIAAGELGLAVALTLLSTAGFILCVRKK